ncbi:hypothetical protein [Flavobacterium capsici]|uniref:DUF3592 domain-containing protein n=1 Tax=Flavobacterium capsici TaxID=3075618 RepID=A0AA96J594_9FLAO|nr:MULTISPECIES: hypothetical protein [unclassified Flavobacterium]WNM20074.1 hypothetical protein RN608_05195 [Flavobacterium sp. PMR2A8]WNM21463.1 hypothetical protein RN605_12365 [Flavobacterium sp. PMTSA4]
MEENNTQAWEPEKTTWQKIRSNKFFPLFLMAFNVLFFFHILPPEIAEEYSISLGILGGVITLILSFWSVLSFVTDEVWEKTYLGFSLVCISSLFVFGYFFISKTVSFSSEELNKNGVYTEASIIDKTRIYGRRGKTIESMRVQFKTEKGEFANAEISITPYQYEQFYEGMVIPIKYSSKYPNIACIAYNKNESQETNQSSKDSLIYQQYKMIYGEEKAKKILEARKNN